MVKKVKFILMSFFSERSVAGMLWFFCGLWAVDCGLRKLLTAEIAMIALTKSILS